MKHEEMIQDFDIHFTVYMEMIQEEDHIVDTYIETQAILIHCNSFFDSINDDSFGGGSSFLRSTINTWRFGGLLYVTPTDGFSSGGHHPHH